MKSNSRNAFGIFLSLCLLTTYFLGPYANAQKRLSQDESNKEESSEVESILNLEAKVSLKNMLPGTCQTDEYTRKLLREMPKTEERKKSEDGLKNSNGPNGIGSYQLVAIAVNFSDHKSSDEIGTENDFKNKLNYIRQFYLDNSSNQLDFDIDYANNGVIDAFYYEVDEPGPEGCSSQFSIIRDNAVAWLASLPPSDPRHIPTSAIDTLLFVMPDESACGNVATYPIFCDGYCRANVKSSTMTDPRVTTACHEIGHTLAVSHGWLDINNDGVSEDDYGDQSTIMGSSHGTYFSAPNFFELGWEPPTTVVSENGVYSLVPHPQFGPLNAGTPSVLVIDIPDSSMNYHISIRSNEGYDDTMSPLFQNGLAIHKYAKIPETYDHGGFDPTYLVGLLSGPDDLFTDLEKSIKIKQLPNNMNGEYQVEITLDDNEPCVGEEPLLEIFPIIRPEEPEAWVYKAGSYQLTLTNRDNPKNCSASSFTIDDVNFGTLSGDQSSPPEITISSGSGGYNFNNLGPGQSQSKSFEIITFQTQDEGLHEVSLKIKTILPSSPADHPELEAKVIYQVPVSSETTAPPAPTELVGEVLFDQSLNCAPYVNLQWQHNPNSSNNFYRIYKDGNHTGESLEKNYSTHMVSPGSDHSFKVTAVNGNNLESGPSNEITLSIPNITSCAPSVDYISFKLTPGTNSAYTKMWLYIEGDQNIQEYSLEKLISTGGSTQWQQVASFDTTFFQGIHNNVRKKIFLHNLVEEPPMPGIDIPYRLRALSQAGVWGVLAEHTVYFPHDKWAYPIFMDPFPATVTQYGTSQVHLKYDNQGTPYAKFNLHFQEQGVITGYIIQEKVSANSPWTNVKSFFNHEFAYGGVSEYGNKNFQINHYGGSQLSHKYRIKYYPVPPSGDNVIVEFTN